MLFFLRATSPTDIYTLSLHDALPISLAKELVIHLLELLVDGLQRLAEGELGIDSLPHDALRNVPGDQRIAQDQRSEEHTSELQSPYDLVCRLLLEKKKKTKKDSYKLI